MEKKLVGLSEILDRVELSKDRVQRIKVYEKSKNQPQTRLTGGYYYPIWMGSQEDFQSYCEYIDNHRD